MGINYGLSDVFAETKAGQWLMANAYKYGFFLAYPQGQERVTGYKYEPWHYRYIGVQNALELKQSGLIMQTYLTLKGIRPQC
jgi:D-alanyl-D-alanine carboxypeptidase